MKKLALMSAVVLIVITMAGSAFAIGEIFKIETTGTEYCGDNDFEKFNANTDVDLWIKINSETEIVVSFTPTFDAGTTFSMSGKSYLTGTKKAAFVAGVLFENNAYVTIQGTVSLDNLGNVKRMQGIFILDSVINPGCFSSGKFKTTTRLQ